MTTIDNRIKSLQDKIIIKRKSLGQSPKTSWQTNCLLNINGIKTNLQVIGTEEELISLYSQIYNLYKIHSEAAKRLKSDAVFKLSEYSFEAWEADFKTRLSVIRYISENQKLQKMEKLLENLESEDAKKERALSEIEETLL